MSQINHFQQEEDQAEASDQGAVPPPKQLTLERQLNKSILIGSVIWFANYNNLFYGFQMEPARLSTWNNRNVPRIY